MITVRSALVALPVMLALGLAACASDPPARPLSPDPDPAGVPCEKEIALECPEGQIDACLETPAAAPTHRCVARGDAGS